MYKHGIQMDGTASLVLSGALVARRHFGYTGPRCAECGRETPNLKAGGGDDVYLESIGFDTVGFEEVIVGAEGREFGREHRQFDQSVLSQRQHLQQGELGEGPVFDL